MASSSHLLGDLRPWMVLSPRCADLPIWTLLVYTVKEFLVLENAHVAFSAPFVNSPPQSPGYSSFFKPNLSNPQLVGRTWLNTNP